MVTENGKEEGRRRQGRVMESDSEGSGENIITQSDV